MPNKPDQLIQKINSASEPGDITEIDLTNQGLTDTDFALFAEIKSKILFTVNKIDVSHNQITRLGVLLPLLSCCDLSQPFLLVLSHNQLTFTNDVEDWQALQLLARSNINCLELQSNLLTGEMISGMAATLLGLSNTRFPLATINLADNRISDFSQLINILLQLLAMPQMKQITLDNNQIAHEPVVYARQQQQITKAIKKHGSITSISADNCLLPRELENAIKIALKQEVKDEVRITISLDEGPLTYDETLPLLSVNHSTGAAARPSSATPSIYNRFIRWTVRAPARYLGGEPTILLPEQNLGKALWLSEFQQAYRLVSHKAWPAFLLSLMAWDLAEFYLKPQDRFGNTVSAIISGLSPNEATLSTAWFYNDLPTEDYTHWLATMGVLLAPLLVGISAAATKWLINPALRKSLHDPLETNKLIMKLKHYRFNWQDRLRLLLPFMASHPSYKQAEWAILRDAGLATSVRDILVETLISCAEKNNGISSSHALAVLANIADSFKETDIRQYSAPVQLALRKNREDALASVIIGAQQKLTFTNLPHQVYNRYLLWSLGQLQSKAWHAFFGLAAAVYYPTLLYALLRPWENLGLNTYELMNYYNKKYACEAENKVWSLRDTLYDCTVCGDWRRDIYSGEVSTSQDCWNGLLREIRLPDHILKAMDRLLLHPDFTIIDLSQQNWAAWSETQWQEFLNKLQGSVKSLDIFNLSSPSPNTVFVQDRKISLLADFLKFVHVKEFIINNQNFGAAMMKQLAPGLNQTGSEFIDLTSTGMGDEGATDLANALPENSIENYKLGNNAISDYGAAQLLNNINNKTVSMDFSGNLLTQQGVDAIATSSSVTSIDLSNTDLSNVDFSTLRQAFTHVKSLKLANCKLSDAQIKVLFAQFDNLNSILESIDLSNNFITDQGAVVCIASLHDSKVTAVNLSGNAITDTGLVTMIEHLPATKIQNFTIANNQFSSAGFKLFIKKLNTTVITVLDVSHNQLGDGCIIAFADEIANGMLVLQRINFASNQIGEKGGLALIDALAHLSSKITHIYLQDNQLTGVVASRLAKILPKTNIVYMDLSGNLINQQGGQDLAAAVPHSQLQHLLLNNNPLGEGVGIAFAKHLITATPREDEIGSDHLSRDELRAIRKSKPQGKLKELRLAHTDLGNDDVEAMCTVLGNTDISIDKLSLESGIANCETSSAARHNVPQIYQAIHGVYRAIKEGLNSPFSFTSKQIGTEATYDTASLIPFIFMGLCIIYFLTKYLPSLESMAEPQPLTTEDCNKLKGFQQKISQLEMTVTQQKQSHAGRSGFFADQYQFCVKKILFAKQTLASISKHNTVSPKQFVELSLAIERIETTIHVLSRENKAMKKLDLALRRVKQGVAVVHHNVVTHELRQTMHSNWQPTLFQTTQPLQEAPDLETFQIRPL